jgi:hypothetical protein
MIVTARPARFFALAAVLLAGGVARAEPPSAAALQAQLRAALGGVFGAEKPAQQDAAGLTVTRQDDSYSILFPIAGMHTASGDAPEGLRSVVHPIGGGRWSIDSLALPTDSTITFRAPPGGLKNAGTGTMAVHVETQAASGVFDPSYATPSRLDATATGVRTASVNAEIQQHAQYDSYHLHLGLLPHPGAAGAAPTLDMDQSTELAGLHLTAAGRTRFSLDAARARLAATAVDLAPDRVGALYGAVIRMMGAVLAGPASAPPTDAAPAPVPMDRLTLSGLLAALPGLADKLDISESADGVTLKGADGLTYTFDHAGIGFGGAASDGAVGAYLDVSLDNLQSPDSPADVRALLPRRLHLHPTLSGIGTAELLATANAATAMTDKGDSGPLVASLLGLFAHGGIRIGITDLALELGDSSITGTGALDMPAPLPAMFSGEGTVMAKNLDALIARLQAEPQAARAAAALLAAKRFAQPEGDALVWRIAYRGGALLVNGTRLNPPPPPSRLQ